ncbi:FAD/NAD(P)-binding oxidoreductase family protein [Trifolium pratense]|uniref:FAD/NAD(P)-binding oxidoreductase family protein n=1 Tax=Trifolium pratense TaxID=57577 RepID=A0A2K3PQU0_TRIPR|nr:FAD/NAD(P)-binding oxidoreductase family protein [Trifolium pratense]
MLVTHWGLSGPAILRLSAWGARYLFSSGYKGRLVVDFIPDVHVESLKTMLSRHKLQFAKQKVINSWPLEFGITKRFWSYVLERQGPFKDEFVTAGGVPLSEISLNTMKSKICSNLFFAGEILNVDGVTGGFNFQNAWSGGFTAGTTIGGLALDSCIIGSK